MSIIETPRLILRLWREEDAADLYRYASDPEVGPAAGWAPHASVEDSLNVLRTILMKPDTWALTLRPSDEPVGSIGIFPSSCSQADGQPEIGYWLARPLWGKGYMPEAVRVLIGLCFDRGAEEVWCAHADFNRKSRRVIEKCGFTYRCAEDWTAPIGDVRRSLYYSLRREDWQQAVGTSIARPQSGNTEKKSGRPLVVPANRSEPQP
jgi:RimJ/RimL family protein N-acetyltransferase